jgi:hypothetical protein
MADIYQKPFSAVPIPLALQVKEASDPNRVSSFTRELMEYLRRLPAEVRREVVKVVAENGAKLMLATKNLTYGPNNAATEIEITEARYTVSRLDFAVGGLIRICAGGRWGYTGAAGLEQCLLVKVDGTTIGIFRFGVSGAAWEGEVSIVVGGGSRCRGSGGTTSTSVNPVPSINSQGADAFVAAFPGSITPDSSITLYWYSGSATTTTTLNIDQYSIEYIRPTA